MNEEKLNEIIARLKLEGKETMLDKAFKLYTDNQLTDTELSFILKGLDYILPESFFKLSEEKKKRYHTHTMHEVLFKDNKPVITSYEVFNRVYFDELILQSKKNKEITKKLMQYAGNLDLMPVYFLAMKEIKLKNLNYALQHESWALYAKAHKISSLFDFVMSVYSLRDSAEKREFQSQIKTFMGKEDGFHLNMDLPFVRFTFLMEYILASLDTKASNTIKIKFLAYKKEYFHENEYNTTLKNGRSLIYSYKESFIRNRILEAENYYGNNEDILDEFKDNGYRAIYYSILEEVAK